MPDQLSLLDTLLQAYQAQADTAGPYANLYSLFGPANAQTGLNLQQQQMFGYNVGPSGGLGYAATPPGGFFGSPQPPPVYGPQQPSTGTGSPYGAPGVGSGGGYTFPSATPTGMPFPTGGGISGTTLTDNGPGGSSSTFYSPPAGTKIGGGNTFMDPYAGTTGPGQTPGYHPGVLDLNTTALNTYGPLATGSLLNANPYLADSLGLQDYNALGASNLAAGAGPSSILQLLNQQAQQGLQSGGALSAQEQRDLSQQNLASFGAGNISHGGSAIAADLLSRDSAVRNRLLQAQQLASGVQGLNTQQQQTQGNLYGVAGGLSNQLSGAATSGITNPLLQILGLGSLNATSNPSASVNDQAQMTNPFLQLGADVAGANFNAAQAQSIADQNQSSALSSGLISAGGSILGGLFSDKRLKKNIKKVGKSPSGITEIEWEYITDPKKRRYHGAEAQDVEKFNPYAVIEDETSGLKAVDYTKIDVPFYEMDNPYRKAA